MSWIMRCLPLFALAAFIGFGNAADPSPVKEPEPKVVAKPGPLTMRLVAKKNAYVLDLGGMTPKQFRKLLEEFDPLGRNGKPLPPGPIVDLEVEITNTSDRPVTILVGGDDSRLSFELKGPGAVSVFHLLTTMELRISTPVTIAPGKSFTHPVAQLATYPRGQNQWYWTEPGEYTLTATWHWQPDAANRGGVSGLTTEPIKLKVVAPGRTEGYLKDGKLLERIEVTEVMLGGFAGDSFSYFAIETDGTWSVGGGVGPPLKTRKETAKGKLTREQLAYLAREFAKYDLALLPQTHGVARHGTTATEIHIGKKTSGLHAGRGVSSPEEDKAIRTRYAGIVEAVRSVCQELKMPFSYRASEGGKDAIVREIDLNGYALDRTNGDPTKPTRIATVDELAKAIPDKASRDRIAKQIDFAKEDLLFFAWTGSNTDRLSFKIEETPNGPVAVFTFVKGQGEDRPHPKCRLFAVAKNWRVEERVK